MIGNPLLLGGEGYQISRSVRLRSSASAYFNRTPASAGNQQKWTWSGWVKRGSFGQQQLFSAGAGTGGSPECYIDFEDNLNFQIFDGTTNLAVVRSTAVYRDPSAWYHVAVSVDTTQATAANRVLLYINGQAITAFALSTYPTQNLNTQVNAATAHRISSSTRTNAYYFDGYLTEVNFIDGQALTPSSFGQTDPVTGVWGAKKYTGTYGTNGFYLPFSNPTVSADITAGATATAPSGGTANNAKVPDGTYLLTNTSTGSAFDIVKYDFGAPIQLTKYFLGAAYFSGGAATWQLQTSNDDSTYTTVASIGVTATGTNYSGTINVQARYVKLRVTSFGTNGQAGLDVLQMLQDGIATDGSGQGNHWVANNISVTAGVTYDSMLDVPTMWADGGNGRGNYAVLNPLNQNSNVSAPTSGNLVGYGYSTNSFACGALGTFAMTTGKWYWEAVWTGGGSSASWLGIAPASASVAGVTTDLPAISGALSYRDIAQKCNSSNAGTAYGATYTLNDTIGIALDLDAGTLTFYKNGISQGVAFSGLTNSYVPMGAGTTNWTAHFNFGQRPFAYTPPTGFRALNTQNLPDATIRNGLTVFDATTWTGTGASLPVNVSGRFQPDLVWVKGRSGATGHRLTDSVRGATLALSSDSPSSNTITDTQGVTAFNSGGFTVGSNSNYNTNAATYIAWQWKRGASQGFDISAAFTGTGAAQTVNHSLGVAPSMIILFSTGGTNWINTRVYHRNLTAGNVLQLSGTAAQFSEPATFASIGSSSFQTTQTSGQTNIAYLFSEVAGFSKFGSYTGNGSTDGPFVYLGFRPRYIMVKSSGGISSWWIYDSARDTYNAATNLLRADLSNADTTQGFPDLLSNGFKIRNTGQNNSGETYIYAAFAENPFKNSLAR